VRRRGSRSPLFRDSDDGNCGAIRRGEHRGGIEQQHPSGADGNCAASGAAGPLDGVEPDGGDVGAAVMQPRRGLEERPTAGPTEFTGATDHPVGAFDCFDCDHVPFPHRHRLPDVQFDELGQERPAEADVGLLSRGGAGRGHHADGGQMLRDEGGRVDEGHSCAGEFIGNGSEEGRVAPIMAKATIPESNRPPVGELPDESQRVVHPGLRNSTDHDGFADAAALEQGDPAPDLDDPGAVEAIAERREFGIELIAESDRDDRPARGAGASSDQDRKDPLACDEADGGGTCGGGGSHGRIGVTRRIDRRAATAVGQA